MKVLLITPINRTYVITPSLGLGYIASSLRQNGHDVNILHCINEKLTFETFTDYVKESKYDIYAFQMFSYDMFPIKKQLDVVKSIFPNSICIVGGYHPSGDPEGVLNDFPQADYGFVSEVELGFPLLLDEIEKEIPDLSLVPNLIYRNKDTIKINPIKLVENLDDLPFPAWDLMDPNTFPQSPHGGFAKSFPSAPIIITRGCPMSCTFCAGATITQRVRKRSIGNVISEIKYLKENFGVNDFLIEDENFTIHRKDVREFCETLMNENLSITWSCPSGVRLDTLSLENLQLMEASGCHSLSLGIEFGSQRIHDLTKKHLTIEKIFEKTDLFNHVKIKTTGFFLFGIPSETEEEMLQTIELAKKLPIQRAQFNNFMPLPGSEIYAELKKEGYTFDYDRYFVHDVAFVPEGLTREKIKNIQRKAYLSFYLRPKIIWGLIKGIISFRQFYWLLRRFVDAVR